MSPVFSVRLFRPFLSFLLLRAAFAVQPPAPAAAQTQPSSELDALASSVAEQIAKSGKKIRKVIVSDWNGPEGKPLPLGAWLADQFSAALARADKGLEVMDRAPLRAALKEGQLDTSDLSDLITAREVLRRLGAEAVVMGGIAAVGNGLGVTLAVTRVSRRMEMIGVTNGKLAMTLEMEALLGVPLEALHPQYGIFRAGAGGVSSPECRHCPDPEYSTEARRKNHEGTVTLEVTITPEGHVSDIKVVKAAGFGLDEKAIEAVKKWRLRPARAPDGSPVPVRVPVEVRFRLIGGS